MSIKSKRSIVASAIMGAVALAGSQFASADPLNDLHKAEARIHKEAAKSQDKINSIYEQSQELLFDYRQTVDETENLKVYNDHVQKLVNDQQKNIDSLNAQIAGIEKTKQGIVPLMYRMIDTLDSFINADVPIALDERKARVERLRKLMGNSNVSTSEQYRQVLEAYEIETEYGSMFRAYQGELETGGNKITVDFVHLGRVVFLAQSLDLKNAWAWNNTSRTWEKLGDEYLKPITTTIRMANKFTAPNLIKVPVFAAESAE